MARRQCRRAAPYTLRAGGWPSRARLPTRRSSPCEHARRRCRAWPGSTLPCSRTARRTRGATRPRARSPARPSCPRSRARRPTRSSLHRDACAGVAPPHRAPSRWAREATSDREARASGEFHLSPRFDIVDESEEKRKPTYIAGKFLIAGSVDYVHPQASRTCCPTDNGIPNGRRTMLLAAVPPQAVSVSLRGPLWKPSSRSSPTSSEAIAGSPSIRSSASFPTRPARTAAASARSAS